MINVDFTKSWGKVSHELINNWTWEEISCLLQTQIIENPKSFKDLGNNGFALYEFDLKKRIKTISNFLRPFKPTLVFRVGLYVGLQPNSKSFPYHRDPGQHVWIWQILGNTIWEVEGQYITLNQNDLLYLSPNTWHRAIPDSPRASISLSLEEE